MLFTMASVILIGDTLVFYMGLASESNTSWGQSSPWVPVGASILYATGLALFGAFHADHATSGNV
jgi:hypothetical protein